MKSVIHLFTAILALSVVQQASADLTIRLTGSTAFRPGTHKAIIAMMGGEANCRIAHGAIVGSTTATQGSFESADYTIIRGTAASIPGTTTVQCTWTGSATGIKDVAQGNNLGFLAASQLPANTGYANAAVSQATSETAQADFAFSDVFQASTPTPTPALEDNQLAIIPFSWVANEGTTGITNMTQQLARALYSNGSQPKKLFTGDDTALDAEQLVLAIGRDNGSGTRITQLAETQYGVFNTVQQWKLTNVSTAVTVAQVWPLNDGVGAFATGNGGYSSGSTIRNFMGWTSASVQLKNAAGVNSGSPQPVSLVAWLGITDSITAVTNGAVRLSYEGVTYDGTNTKLIYEGLYTGWGYLQCTRRPVCPPTRNSSALTSPPSSTT
ncbi:MAG: hypothetical protein IPK22_23015 [Verrucomicrobiaceae bacterium]|nr:hypothetical protein [Verrucomicrobiaceae bacterium]